MKFAAADGKTFANAKACHVYEQTVLRHKAAREREANTLAAMHEIVADDPELEAACIDASLHPLLSGYGFSKIQASIQRWKVNN